MEPRADGGVVEALSDKLQHLMLTRGKFVGQPIADTDELARRLWGKIVERCNELLTRRLGIEQHVVAAFERYQLRAGYETCHRPAPLEVGY